MLQPIDPRPRQWGVDPSALRLRAADNDAMRTIAYVIGLVLVASACRGTTTFTEADPASTNRVEATVAEVEPTAIALPTVAEPEPTTTSVAEPTTTEVPLPAATATAVPTTTPLPTATPTAPPALPAVAEADHSGLAGRRGLTLQWISWEPDEWGSIEFVPLVDGSYMVSGEQTGRDGDFVVVEGIVVRVSERELRFTGDVIVQVSHNNDGEPCVRGGDLTFLATGDRRFWRMQDLLNCDDIVTDYVDIYFG